MKQVVLIAVLLFAAALEAGAAEFYVAWYGDDANPGTQGKPFASLERARDVIRHVKRAEAFPEDGVTVWLRGGVYPLTESFVLTEEDSGTKSAPVVYRAVDGEEVRISGGREVKWFRPVIDPKVLSRIAPECRDEIVQADLHAIGIEDFGELTPRGFGRPVTPAHMELFFGDKPMTLARWPNQGWSTITDVPNGKDGGKFGYEGDRPSRWASCEDVWLHGYWTWPWAESFEKVDSIDTQARVISTCPPHGVYGYEAGKRWRALNILEELDEPGEYYVDRSSGILYFYPPSAESLPVLEDPLLHHTGIRPVYPPSTVRESAAYVSMLEDPLVHLNGASHVMLRGLTFEVCRGVGIRLDGGTGNTIAGCTVRNIGTNAVEIRGGTDNGIVSCDIYEAGDTAITLAGGDRKTLTPGRNYAVNNHIHDFSRWCRTYRPALSISGVGQRAAHNYIHSAPHMGIGCHGNEHVVEYNEIHSILYETGDAGAYYMGRDWSQRGNIVRFNFIHHLGSFDDKFSRHGFSETMAVYLDDWTSDTLVYGNMCYKANRAVLVGGGRDNTIENNIFIDCKPAIHVDARGLGWAKNYFDGTTTTLFDRLEAINYSQPPYSEKYPKLLTLLDDEPAVPKYNRILRNICVGGKWLDLHGEIESVIEVEDNLVDQDPMFVDAENMDFTLKSDSPALKLGFKQIPMDKIGLYVDDYRRTLPEAGPAPQAR